MPKMHTTNTTVACTDVQLIARVNGLIINHWYATYCETIAEFVAVLGNYSVTQLARLLDLCLASSAYALLEFDE